MEIVISVTVERMSGPFRSREDIADALMSEMALTEVEVDGSVYEVTDVSRAN